MPQDGFISWLKQHSYAIIIAVLLIVSNYGVNNYRLSSVEKDLQAIELRLNDLEADLLAVQLNYAADMASIRVALESIQKTQEGFAQDFKDQATRTKNFYEKYGKVLNPDGK
ncbi:MAG: hypothetical protein RLO03_13935 [Balneola sp.]